jgi:hypothetical protein
MGERAEVASEGVTTVSAGETLFALEAVRTLCAILAKEREVTVELRFRKVAAVAEVAVAGRGTLCWSSVNWSKKGREKSKSNPYSRGSQ